MNALSDRRPQPGTHVCAILLAVQLAMTASPLVAQGAQEGEVRLFDLLDNGDLALAPPAVVDSEGRTPIPWWRATNGADQYTVVDDRPALRTAPGERIEQPVAAYAPTIDGLVVRGSVRGKGRVVILDGEAGRAVIDVGSDAETFSSFEFDHARLAASLGRSLVPRLVLRLESAGVGPAHWRDLAVQVPLPVPTEADLRAEILRELEWIFDLWLTRGLDDVGTGKPYLCHIFDVVTGEPLFDIRGGPSSTILYDSLLKAFESEPVPAWRAAHDAFVDAFLSDCLHPETGMPMTWDCAADVPIADDYMEIAPAVALLVDLAESGPETQRARARAATEKVGRTILAHGVLPDGEVSAKYRARDAAPHRSYSHLRRLNLPAQLERIGELTGDEAYGLAVREAVANLEYTHAWPGTWHEIDPGFDDTFGNYGARALIMWRASPDEKMFKRFVLGGYENYALLWEQALTLGGNIAADQVRCWKILADIAELEPTVRPRVARLLQLAARTHFKGGQYAGGAWGDVTIGDFDPKADLQVGDLLGLPKNFLSGLATIYDPSLAAEPGGPDPELVRAMFTTVLRSTQSEYKRPYGYVRGRSEQQGHNPSQASLGLAVGLVEMLARLTPGRVPR